MSLMLISVFRFCIPNKQIVRAYLNYKHIVNIRPKALPHLVIEDDRERNCSKIGGDEISVVSYMFCYYCLFQQRIYQSDV